MKPASRSAAMVDASSSRLGFAVRSTDISRRNSAEIAINAAVIAKTTPVLAVAMRTPARAGPAKTAMLSIPLATAFAAVSSSGVRESDGVRAAWDERNGVVAIVAAIDRP